MARTLKLITEKSISQNQSITNIRVLFIEDSSSYSNAVKLMLGNVMETRFDITVVKRLSDGLRYLEKGGIDIVLLDLSVSDNQGNDFFDKVYAQVPSVPIIVLADIDKGELAVEAVRKGAQDYLIKEQMDGILLARAAHYAIERKRILDELRESEDRFWKFIDEATFEGIIIHDGVKILDINQQAATMYGYDREELIGIDLFTTIAPEFRKMVAKHIRDKYEKPYETVAIRKDGVTFPAKVCAKHIPFHGGIVRGVVIHDITERKRAEEESRAETVIFENIHDGIIVTDLEGNIMSWNPAAERMFGYYKGEVFHQTIGMLTTKVIKGTLREGRWIGEMNFIRKDGTEGICEMTVIPLRDELGTISSLFEVCHDITERKRSEKKLQKSYDQLRETLIATVNTLASTIEMRDPYTAGHQRRVTLLACAIAEEMGLTDDQFDGLRMAGLIHDLGKINVPAEILSKPGRINDIEFSIIRYHPQICHDILKSIELPWPVAKIVLHHHERLDGSGYPQGLKGDEIMLEARILAVADVIEAMASHRPYRPALGIKLALEEIMKNRGILYDPGVVDACLQVFSKKKFQFE
jgi:PAS domain S-box-containing protein